MKFIPKHYLLSDPSFWDPVFIEWNYTDTILLTSYDLLRNDALIYFLHSNSMTLKELMKENGFPKQTKIFADSGIFMLEWFKLTKSKTFKQDYSNINLPIEEIKVLQITVADGVSIVLVADGFYVPSPSSTHRAMDLAHSLMQIKRETNGWQHQVIVKAEKPRHAMFLDVDQGSIYV